MQGIFKPTIAAAAISVLWFLLAYLPGEEESSLALLMFFPLLFWCYVIYAAYHLFIYVRKKYF